MSSTLADVLSEISQSELSTISGIEDFDVGNDMDHIQLAKALWIDEFGAMNQSSLEAFADEDVKDPGFSKRLWDMFLAEFHLLLCTESEKYVDIRKAVMDLKGKPASIIIATISAAVAKFIGLEAGLLVPFIAILIKSTGLIGINVACKLISEQIEGDS